MPVLIVMKIDWVFLWSEICGTVFRWTVSLGWTLNYLWQSLVPLDISTDSIIVIRRVRGYSRFFLPTDRVNFLALTEGVVYVWRSESSNYACINKMVISADCGWGSIEVDGWPGEIREQVGT